MNIRAAGEMAHERDQSLDSPATRSALMNTAIWRWLLAPRTSWHAWRLVRASGNTISYDTAWREVRLRLCPDEIAYRRHGHFPDGAPPN